MPNGTSEWWFSHYVREVCSFPLLTRQEEHVLAREVHAGSATARDKMICSNMRLVLATALEMRRPPFALYDLMAEGTRGLIVAVDRFDHARETRFSTYAIYWIRQGIRGFVDNNSGPVRTPIHSQRRSHKLRYAIASMTQELGREPTSVEIAHELGIDAGAVEKILHSGHANHVSLDAPTETGGTIADVLASETPTDPAHNIEMEATQVALFSAMEKLTPIEQSVLVSRFGIGGVERKTLEEIGAERSLTRERIRQIQERALRKLRRAGNWPDFIFAEIRDDRLR